MNHVRSKAVAPVKQTVLGSLSECPAHCPGRVNDCVWSAWRSWTMPPKSGSHSRRGGQHGSGQGRASQSGGAGSGGARARSDPPPPPDLDYDYDYDYDDVGYDYYGDDPYGDDLDYGALMDFGGLLHSSLGSDAFVVVEAMREAMVARGRSREALGPSPPAPAHATTATGMNRRSAVRVSHAWSNGCRQTTEWCALVVRGRPEDRCQRVAGTSFVATCASTVILCVQCYYYVVPVRGAAVPPRPPPWPRAGFTKLPGRELSWWCRPPPDRRRQVEAGTQAKRRCYHRSNRSCWYHCWSWRSAASNACSASRDWLWCRSFTAAARDRSRHDRGDGTYRSTCCNTFCKGRSCGYTGNTFCKGRFRCGDACAPWKRRFRHGASAAGGGSSRTQARFPGSRGAGER